MREGEAEESFAPPSFFCSPSYFVLASNWCLLIFTLTLLALGLNSRAFIVMNGILLTGKYSHGPVLQYVCQSADPRDFMYSS